MGTRICRNCGKEFSPPLNSNGKPSATNYCNSDCCAEYYIKTHPESLKKHCKICNKEFVSDYKIENGHSIINKSPYCSKECEDKAAICIYSNGKNDECYTLRYGVLPILKYLNSRFENKKITIWCPFDKEDSEFVKVFRENNFKVIASHIGNGQDFYRYEPKEQYDVIISNPPFTNKRGIFERVLSFNKPFALLFSLVWLNDAAPKQIFMSANKKMQILMFDKRMCFKNNGKIEKTPSFSSGYLCYDFLPEQICLDILDDSEIKKG